LALAQEKLEFTGWLDNSAGWLCRKAGVGTLPILFVMSQEATLTRIMHHYVFLPTLIAVEIAEFSKRVLARLPPEPSILKRSKTLKLNKIPRSLRLI
jgi:hypothetical protein